MTAQPDPQTTDSRPEVFDPFPEPRTMPSGWDMSEFGYGPSNPNTSDFSRQDLIIATTKA